MNFELALATVMQRIMSEDLFPGTPPQNRNSSPHRRICHA